METEHPAHTEAILIPGYLNGTLTPEEHRQMETHLKACQECRHELQEVEAMQKALKSAIHDRPSPSPRTFTKIMDRIHQERETGRTEITRTFEASWWERLEAGFHSLFAIRWVPALASVLIIGQAVLLLSILSSPNREAGPDPGLVIERGIPQGTPIIPAIRIQVRFMETAQEIHLRTLVQELGGEFTQGPSPDGWYTLRFSPKAGISPESIVSSLQEHPDLVNHATLLQP
jgi:hypothetical protein